MTLKSFKINLELRVDIGSGTVQAPDIGTATRAVLEASEPLIPIFAQIVGTDEKFISIVTTDSMEV